MSELSEYITWGIINGRLEDILGFDDFRYTDKPHKIIELIKEQVRGALLEELERNLAFSEKYWHVNAHKHFKHRIVELTPHPTKEIE